MKDKNQKSIALSYAAIGWCVVPLHSVWDGACSCRDGKNCSHPGKHPRTQHGVKDATASRKQIKAWWKKWPQANIGVATGAKSGVVVIDVDPRNGGKGTFGQLQQEAGLLPKTATSKTGGNGRHYIFRYPDVPVRSDSSGKLLGPGLDVLADGKYFVAPRSRHVSGKLYKWVEGRSIDEIRPVALPASWLERLGKAQDTSRPPDNVPNDSNSQAGIVPEGHRNSHLTSLGGNLQRSGLSNEALRAALAAENLARCSPPLPDAEVEKIAASIAKYPTPMVGERIDDAEVIVREVLDHQFDGGKHLIYGIDGGFWHYDVRLWRPVTDKWIDGRILEMIQNRLPRTGQKTASLMHQARELLQAKLSAKEDPFGFAADPLPVINCKNGELWISNDGNVELRPHRPESRLRHCLDVEYDPDATCPVYTKTIDEIFSAAKNRRGLVCHWDELAGYLIQSSRNIPIVVILAGGGSNGKTRLIRTVIRLMGRSLVQAQRVGELEKSRFAMGSLLGKLMFYDDDVTAGTRLPDGLLKTMSEAKEVTGELKYKEAFNFIVRTVPVLLCNNTPSLADLSHGMRRRLMVVPFDRTFTPEEDDKTLFDRIWATELPGIFNRALQGLARLIKRGHRFKYPEDVTYACAEFLQEANPLPDFIAAQCTFTPKGRCRLTDFYIRYCDWAKQAGITMTQQQKSIKRNLQHLNYPVKHGNRGLTIYGLDLK